MTLQASGSMTDDDIATELSKAGQSISTDDADVVALADLTDSDPITIPDSFYGKSAGGGGGTEYTGTITTGFVGTAFESNHSGATAGDGILVGDQTLTIGGETYWIEYIGDTFSNFYLKVHTDVGRTPLVTADITSIEINGSTLLTSAATFSIGADGTGVGTVATWEWPSTAGLAFYTAYPYTVTTP